MALLSSIPKDNFQCSWVKQAMCHLWERPAGRQWETLKPLTYVELGDYFTLFEIIRVDKTVEICRISCVRTQSLFYHTMWRRYGMEGNLHFWLRGFTNTRCALQVLLYFQSWLLKCICSVKHRWLGYQKHLRTSNISEILWVIACYECSNIALHYGWILWGNITTNGGNYITWPEALWT